jgi:alanine dehydrogenase
VLLLSEEDIVKALPLRESMPDAIDAIEEAERAHALGRTKEQQRISLAYQEERQKRRSLVVLPAIVGGMGAAVRTYTYGGLHLGTTARTTPRRLQGITALYANDDFGMVAVLEDGHLNDVRTAAPTGVAARHLSPANATQLAIIGTGELAGGQLAAVCAVRPIERIRVYSRTPEHVAHFVEEARALLGIETVGCASGSEAVDGADIVITITNARQPVIERSWLSPGTTLLCIANNEVDEATVLDSQVVTTSIERLLDPREAIEPFATLVKGGRFSSDSAIELGDIVVGKATARNDPRQLVTFVSTGSPHWDVAVPLVAYQRALAMGLGTEWP